MTNDDYLRDSVALVTGGARGIGLATARSLARRGARVALADVDGPAAERAAAGLPPARGYALDVSDRDAFARVVASVESDLGPVDVLVNNAGVMALGPFLELEPRVARREIDVNLLGVVNGMQLVVPAMRERGRGRVVNVSSAAGRWGVPGESVYAATKHAITGLSEVVRRELRGSPVRVSVAFMGPVSETGLAAGMRSQRGIRVIPAARVGEAIASRLAAGPPEIWIPRTLGWLQAAGHLMPRPVRERAEDLMGLGHVATRIDWERRAPYEREAFG